VSPPACLSWHVREIPRKKGADREPESGESRAPRATRKRGREAARMDGKHWRSKGGLPFPRSCHQNRNQIEEPRSRFLSFCLEGRERKKAGSRFPKSGFPSRRRLHTIPFRIWNPRALLPRTQQARYPSEPSLSLPRPYHQQGSDGPARIYCYFGNRPPGYSGFITVPVLAYLTRYLDPWRHPVCSLSSPAVTAHQIRRIPLMRAMHPAQPPQQLARV
jgi:hypothetical protein